MILTKTVSLSHSNSLFKKLKFEAGGCLCATPWSGHRSPGLVGLPIAIMLCMKTNLPLRSSIPTPALVIDLAALERNIAAMAAAAAEWGVSLRPHAKSHKCVAIAARQVAAGALGVSCATLDEVAAMIAGGVSGLLLTSPIAGEPKFAHLERLLRRDPSVMVVADDPAAVAGLGAVSNRVGAQLRVLVDFDVGQRRTGCRSVDAAVALAKEIRARSGLVFSGIQAYAGHIQHIVVREARCSAAMAVADQVRKLRAALERAGLEPQIVTGAGTGSVEGDGPGGVYTELQPGSYIFMDTDYLAVEGVAERYSTSLFVDTTVVGVQWDDHVTTDAGTKAFALNGPPPMAAGGAAGWAYSYDGDEFGRITLGPGARRPAWGERLAFVVSHCDPTVVLYPQFVCVRGERVEAYWPITPRQVGV
jgi:D-serine deaminase-like pyridoxal phosphate-dependent protein